MLAWLIPLAGSAAFRRCCDPSRHRHARGGNAAGKHRYRKDGHWYLGASPSKKSVERVRRKVGDLLQPSNVGTWEEVRDRLNQMLRGWSAYFSCGTRYQAYRAIDNHVYQRVRDFLRRRHGVQSRGTRRFSDVVVFGELGVLRLRHVHLGPPPCASDETSRKAGCRKSARPV